MIDESYSEESFIKQFKEGGVVSFRNFPCPVHGNYPSLIANYSPRGASVCCCMAQKEWFEKEINRLGLRAVADEWLRKSRLHMKGLKKKMKLQKRQGEMMASILLGAKVIEVGPIEPALSSYSFTSIRLKDNNGQIYELSGDDEGIVVEAVK